MTKPGFIAPRDLLDTKPPHGAPCNRCGLCCMATLCPLAQHVFGHEQGPCPALSFNPEGSVCGLVDDPMRFARTITTKNGTGKTSAAAAHLIGSGTGCDARFNGEPPDLDFYAKLSAWDDAHVAETAAAKKIWRA
jgi:hypothetical protein